MKVIHVPEWFTHNQTPMLQWDFFSDIDKFMEDVQRYKEHYKEYYDEDDEETWLWDEPPVCPCYQDYIPHWEWVILHDTRRYGNYTNKGMNLSPAFETKDELINWLVENGDYSWQKYSIEWARHVVNNF